MLQELERSAIMIREIWREALLEFREWTEEENPFSEGFRKRLIVLLLGPIYKQNQRGEDYGKKFLEDHALNDCPFARQTIVAPLAALDDIFLQDRAKGAINMTAQSIWRRRPTPGCRASRW